jgi:kynurenine formamidase
MTPADPLPPLTDPPTVLGAPSRFGPANVTRALAASRSGEIVNLNLDLADPRAPFNRPPLERTVRLHNQIRPRADGSYMVINDDQVSFALQGSSQWDSYAHFGVIAPGREGVYHGGAPLTETYPEPAGATLGIQALGPAIVARGVLLDLVATLGVGAPYLAGDVRIHRSDLERAIAEQQVAIEPGDAVLIYTGLERRRAALGGEWPRDSAGLDGDTTPLWERLQPIALASDNPAVDAMPGDNELHVQLLNRLGIPLGELWALDALAQRCRADGRWDFLLVGVPLNIPGAFGSTANAVAIR